MNHCVVPDFQMNDDYPNISSPIFTSRKSTIADEEIMELIWQNGQVIVQSQNNQRCIKKTHLFSDQSAVEESVAASAPLYMQEDEMNSWLQSPLDDDDSSFADFLFIPPCSSAPPEESHVSTAEQPLGEYTRQNYAAVTSAAAPLGEIGTSTAEKPVVERIASSSSRQIIPQLKCSDGESIHRLQNFQYTRQNCAALSSAAAPPGEIDTSTAEPIIPQLRCTEGESTHRLQNFQYTRQNCAAVSSAAAPPAKIDTSTAEIRQLPQLRFSEAKLSHRLQNFRHFLPNEAICHSVKASTVAESNETPISSVPEYMISRISDNVTSVSAATATAEIRGGTEVMTSCDQLILTSSTTSCSGGNVSASAKQPPHQAHAAAEDRKRKSRESEDDEGQSEDVEFESADAKKQVRSSTSAKKSRAAEVHNLSERKRRDRINEKMRALQELIPRCNKSDKASMLAEAIEYLKSLQLQVQMMSTGCSMVPMMYPGIPQYMPTMGMNMGMGMSMEMGMNRPMVPYPSLMPGPAIRNATAAAQMALRYPLPAYHLPPFPAPDPSRIPVANQPDPPRLNSLVGGHNTNQPRLPNFSDPYHQYFGLQQAQTDVSPETRSTGTAEQQ